MPSINVATPLGYLGVLAIFFGIFLIVAGLDIIRLENIRVMPGTKTWVFGSVMAILGIFFLFLDFRGSIPVSPSISPTSVPGPLELYDDFENTSFDGTINTNLWQPKLSSQCIVAQREGSLVFTNSEVQTGAAECLLTVVKPQSVESADLGALEADVMLSHVKATDPNALNQGITFSNTTLPRFEAFCGLAASSN